MVRIEFCCDKCGNKQYQITHGYNPRTKGFTYAVECVKCHDEAVIAEEQETKVSD